MDKTEQRTSIKFRHYRRGTSAVVVAGCSLLLFLSCRVASAQAVLENPQPNSFQSGISVISGWACDAIAVVIAIDDDENFDEDADGFADADVELLFPVYGTSRGDTMGVCGDTDNGFGVLYNWNNLGDGVYTVWAVRRTRRTRFRWKLHDDPVCPGCGHCDDTRP